VTGVCKRCDSKGDSGLSAPVRENEGQALRVRERETGAKGGRGGTWICREIEEAEGLRRQGVRPFSSAAKNSTSITDSYWLSSVN
jgi:hypothetical protein